jgi:hypothetical protein
MLRAIAVCGILVIAPAANAATTSAPWPTPVPDYVKARLVDYSIGADDAVDVAPASLKVPLRQARQVALKHFDWALRHHDGSSRVGRITVHLVRLSAVTTASGRVDFIGPPHLHVGDLAWLVVIRDVSIPNLGPPAPPGRPPRPLTYLADIGVFVRTDTPNWVSAVSL